MRIEIPTSGRCCICLPLRYGLIVWGYIRLILAGLLSINLPFVLHRYIEIYMTHDELRYIHLTDILYIVFIMCTAFVDTILVVIFLIGCHMKKVNLIIKYYFYSLWLLALIILLSIYNIFSSLHYYFTEEGSLGYFFGFIMLDVISPISYIAIQIYVVVLVKSEITKLSNDCQFRFENLAVEGECSVKIEVSNENINKIKIETIDVDKIIPDV